MKKKLWLTSLLAALSITVAAGVTFAEEQTVAPMAAENWQAVEMDKTYVYGTSFEVPAREVEVGGQKVAATATVTLPDGLVLSTATIPLSQPGKYTVTYRAVVGDVHCVKEESFLVENKGYFVQTEKSSVEYGTYTNYGANSSGLLVRLAEGDKLTFSQLIDVSNLSGEQLVETFVTPNMMGSYDFSKLVFTFTDALDSSIYLRYQLRRYVAEERGMGWGYVDVSGNGQLPVGCENGTYRINGLGSPINFTFTAAVNGNYEWFGPVKQYAPDKNKCGISFNQETKEARTGVAHIAHLDNLALFEKAWLGWPSGQARLTIHAEEYKSETANFCITNVLGIEDLSKNFFAESDKPIVEVSKSQDEMPKGQVGYAYTIPDAMAYDYYSGDCTVKAAVYRDYATDSPISVGVENGKFNPTSAGWYTIKYTAQDALGNEASEIRNVYVAQDLGDITVTLPENATTEVLLGNWVQFADASYEGDCGLAEVKAVLSLGDEEYALEDGKFLFEIAGDWKVKYIVTDYIGRTGEAEYTLTAKVHSSAVQMEELVLPEIFVSDAAYVLPALKVNDYSTGKPVQKDCQIIVTDKNGAKTYKVGDTFVPSVAENGDKVSVSYQCNGEEIVNVEVPAVIVKLSGKVNAKNYIYGEDVVTSYKDANGEFYEAGVEIAPKEAMELCGWTFATPQLATNLSLMMEGIEGRNSYKGLVVTLTDSLNKKEAVSATLTAKSSGTTLTVGDTSVDVNGVNMMAEKQYVLSFTNGKFQLGSVAIAPEKTVYGEAFEGFSSSLVYIKVDMVKADADAAYKLLSVSGTNLSRRNLEVFAPNFEILGDFGGNQSINATYEIFPALACDVFSPNTTLTLTVTAPDGSIVTDNNGVRLENVPTDKSYFITLSQLGKYQASYYMVEKDWVVSNPLTLAKSIFVIDETAPKAKFVNATVTTAKVGDVIVMPELSISDNVSANEKMTITTGVYNPNGQFIRFKENENAIKCAYAGKYKFIAMVFDEFGNMACVTHIVTVSEK